MNKYFHKFNIIFIFCLITILLFIPSVSFARQNCGGTPQVTVQTAWRANSAIDPLDNIHIVQTNFFNNSMNLYYSKISKSGGVVIDDMLITSVPNSVELEEPSISVNSSGDISIVWSDNRDGNWELYFSRLGSSGSIAVNEKRLTQDPAVSWVPSIVSDPQGFFHVTWIDNRDGNTEIYYKKIDNSGNDIIADKRLSNSPAIKTFLSSEIDSAGNIHLVWTDNLDGENELFYMQVNLYGDEIIGELQLTANNAHNFNPHIKSDSAGYIHAVWSSNKGGAWAVYYTKFSNSGNIVIPEAAISDPLSSSGEPTLYIDRNGRVFIAFASDRGGKSDIYSILINTNGNIIENIKAISNGQAASFGPKVFIDSAGTPQFLWVDGFMLANHIYKSVVTATGGSDPKKEINEVIVSLNAIKGRVDPKVTKDIEKAVSHLTAAIEGRLWVDPCHLTATNGGKVFENIKNAVKELVKFFEREKDEDDGKDEDDDGASAGVKEELEAQIVLLYNSGRTIAQKAIDEARENGGGQKKIKKGEEALIEAEQFMAQKKYEHAISSLAKGWRYGIH